MIKSVFLALFLSIFYLGSYSQNQSTDNKPLSFVFVGSNEDLSNEDLLKISQTNFDDYRFYGIRKKIQLVNGPLIELFSIKELQQKGDTFSENLVLLAKSRSESFIHETILRLDIGLGIYPANEPK